MYEGPGIYRHHKGGYYRAIDIAEHESTGKKTVVYRSLNVEHEISRAQRGVGLVNRPLNAEDGDDAWNEEVNGKPRFVKLRFDTFDMVH